MSARWGRRETVRSLAWTALLPFAALGRQVHGATAAWPAHGAGAGLPTGFFMLERVLTRGLADGAAIVVTRRWRIAIAAAGPGMTVSGDQVFAEVAAPGSLGGLAAIERARSASGMFPMELGADGLIRRWGQADGTALVRALDTGRALMRAMPIPAADRSDADGFLAQLAALGAEAVSQVPSDLLFPRAGSDTVARELALPGGGSGTLTVTTDARAASATGLLQASERRIVTRIGASERMTRELWTLGSA